MNLYCWVVLQLFSERRGQNAEWHFVNNDHKFLIIFMVFDQVIFHFDKVSNSLPTLPSISLTFKRFRNKEKIIFVSKQPSLTCITGAPAHKNWKATSAESIPPVAKIGYFGKAFLQKKAKAIKAKSIQIKPQTKAKFK